MIVENLPSPFDRRVWQEATTLRDANYEVSIICPTGKGFDKKFEIIDGIYIYRHNLPFEADGALGYLVEYSAALFWQFYLSFKVFFGRGFDVIHACNPPDMIFLVGGFFKLFGKKFVFDHHDINPELYVAKFGRKDFFYKLMVFFEWLTFKTADVSIATNESYKKIAIERGKMPASRVHVVRSGPKLDRMRIIDPVLSHKHGKSYLIGYVGVIGKQEGVDHLLRAAKFIVHDCGRNDVHFGIVGGGTELESLKNYTTELGLDHCVTFYGRVSDQVLLEVLNTADVCVNPDVANEMNDKSTMNKIMEYMALRKPIVQYDLVEGRFSAEGASLYAKGNDEQDMANKIIQLLDSADLRSEMGEIGYQRIKQSLEWKFEIPKLLKVYEQVFRKSDGQLNKSSSLKRSIK